jgi:hypothetical protein
VKSLNILAALAMATLLIGCNQNAGAPADAPGEPDVNINVPPAAPDVDINVPPPPPADGPDVNITVPPADAPPAQ